MPRKEMKLKKPQRVLLQCERHFLLTGEVVPPGGKHWRRDFGESWVRPFILSSPAGQDEARELWVNNREELLEEWKRQGHRGKPWAQREFGSV
jgi:hypothetical protein